MPKKCIYCNIQLDENSAIDICRNCGLQVWGKQMFNAITQNMESARDSGDLYQGSVSATPAPEQHLPSSLQNPPTFQSTPQQQISLSPQKTPNPNPPSDSSTLTKSQNPLSSLVADAIQTQQDLLEESKHLRESQGVPEQERVEEEPASQIIEQPQQKEDELIFS